MIVPMKKYSFLVYHAEYLPFLEKLQELGLVHIIEKESGVIEDEALAVRYRKAHQLKDTIKLLSQRNIEAKDDLNGNASEVLSNVLEIKDKIEHKNHEISVLKKEILLIEPWGQFEWSTIDKLKEDNIDVQFFITGQKIFKEKWLSDYNIEIINKSRSLVYFVLLQLSGDNVELNAEIPILPSKSLNELKVGLEKLRLEVAELEKEIDQIAATKIGILEKELQTLSESIDFNVVVLNTKKEAEEKLMIIEGWVPKDREEETGMYLSTTNIFYDISEPKREESVPIKLKNNKFSRLFEVIGDLYSRPKYGEMDLTPYFAPFYWLFFGFCLGDAGYGIVISILGGIMIFKGSEKLTSTFKLVTLLGLSTILFGLIGGTFFGLNLYELKLGYYGELAAKFDAQGSDINDKLFKLSLMLGAVQIIFGMVIKVFNQIKMFGWKYAVGAIGWLVIVLGFASVLALKNVSNNLIITNVILWFTIIVGGSCAFLFKDPDSNIFVNFASGIWDAYNVATGIMGDLLSYIRLFALGISSAILGYVFNNLAMAFAPEGLIGKILVMTIILAFGHGINLFMAALGSFVHPVRLTFVEFYKNAGFTGGGIKYNPFKKKNN